MSNFSPKPQNPKTPKPQKYEKCFRLNINELYNNLRFLIGEKLDILLYIIINRKN